MPRGGARIGAGRKPHVQVEIEQEAVAAANKGNMDPLQYLLQVMNDRTAAPERRDRAALAALPLVNGGNSVSRRRLGKKQLADQEACEMPDDWKAVLS